MGRSCTELWTNIHFGLKVVSLILLIFVEFLVLGWSTSAIHHPFIDGYFFVAISILIIVIYGYTWFDSTVILETCMVITAVLMLFFSLMFFTNDHSEGFLKNVDYKVYTNDDKYSTFVGLTTVILLIDLLLLILEAVGKKPRPGGG